MAVAEPTARQNHGGIPRVGNVDRQTGRDQLDLTRPNDHGSIDCSPKVKAC